MIDWSYDLLGEEERTLLRCLGVCSDWWTLEDAEAASLHLLPVHTLLDRLSSLADKSLVLVEEQEEGLRYRMLETVREYALLKLKEKEEEDLAGMRHRDPRTHPEDEAGPCSRSSSEPP